MEIRSNEVSSGGQTSFTLNKIAIRMFLLVESGSIDAERWLGLSGCNMDLTWSHCFLSKPRYSQNLDSTRIIIMMSKTIANRFHVHFHQLSAQRRVGLLAVKMLPWERVGALFWVVNLGYFKVFLLNCLVLSRITELGGCTTVLMMKMFSPLALCLPAISLYIWETAPHSVLSLYSLYMFTTPVLVKYLSTIP